MRRSWNEIRIRAADFARQWKDEGYEKGEAQSFYNEFFDIFGIRRREVAGFEWYIKRLDNTSGYIDLLWPGLLLVEQKSMGRSLSDARDQAHDYFIALPPEDKPRYILLSDFQTFELLDISENEETYLTLAELPKKVEKFSFIRDRQYRTVHNQIPVSIKASELMGHLHDALQKSGYKGHDLELFLVRAVFCLFADDTGIFEPNIFLEFVENRTREDGADLGPLLLRLFEVLNTPENQRQAKLDEELNRFPYVNGDLFAERLTTPDFDSEMRKLLLEACRFDWTAISPAIFGALFQSVMDPKERRAKGAHYTTEENILKVIEPLFLDDLREEFTKLKVRRDSRRRVGLEAFHKRLANMKFFDPACGCGNFLIVAYRELRELEIDLIREHRVGRVVEEQQVLNVADLSQITVDQFYGIEIGEFATRIAETALWMMDHIMNITLSLEFGQAYSRIPLGESPHIKNADALEFDWADFLPPKSCSFIFGNPPYSGATQRKDKQRAQINRISALDKTSRTLDYVTAWFIKAGQYIQDSPARIGFVATNSITQGEQVAQLWPILLDRYKLEIDFAHRTFPWDTDVRGKANVHVVILGLDKADRVTKNKRLYSYNSSDRSPIEIQHKAISPYLFDGGNLPNPHLVVSIESRPINNMPELKTGVQMIDNGFYTFNQDQYENFISLEPESQKFFRKYIGGDEYINGFHRWILYLPNASPSEIKRLPHVWERVKKVKEWRASRSRPNTVAMAAYPTTIGVDERLTEPFLVLPNTSSERREYIPIGWLSPDVIANQKLRILPRPNLWQFALLTSAMHMAWMRTITGRMKSDYMYSVGVVYNTFPTPSNNANLSKLKPLAQSILDARAAYPEATLAELYDPISMPPNLRKAHQTLDRAVDRLYRRSNFSSEQERVEHLFTRYERMINPISSKKKYKPRARRKK